MAHHSRPHRDRGAQFVEWGAALLVLATIVVVLVGPPVPQTVKDGVAYAICQVFNFNNPGDCESPADKRFKPQAGCNVSTSVETVGGNVSVAIVEAGADVTFIRTTDSQGRVTITAVNSGSLGVGTGVGVGFNAGNVNIGANASVHAGVKVGVGDSWQFNSRQEADQFMGEFKKILPGDVADSGPLGLLSGAASLAAGDLPQVRESDIERYEVELSADAGLATGLGFGPPNDKPASNRREKVDRRTRGDQPGADVNPNLNAYAEIEGGGKAIVENNKRTGEKSVTMQVAGSAKAGANYVVDGVQARGELRGAVKLTYDKNGNLSKLTLTRTGIVNDRSEITTTELPITNDAERAAVYQNLLTDESRLGLDFDGMTPDAPPGPNATSLQQLLYDKGKTSKVQYDYDASNKSYGASVKAGLMLGLGVDISSANQNATGGQYLGARGPDGHRQWKNFEQCRA
jgi:hypothetical protein